MLTEGDMMPRLTVVDETGRSFETTELIGPGPLVLWFYPKDFTSG